MRVVSVNSWKDMSKPWCSVDVAACRWAEQQNGINNRAARIGNA